MPAQYYAVATLAGQAKIAAAIANQGAIDITAVAAGDGNGQPVTPLETMVGLVHEVWRGAPTSVGRDPAAPTQVLITAVIPDTAAPATIRELALFTSDGQCFAVANYPATDLAAPSQGAVNSIEVIIPIVVDTAANVAITITVNPNEIVRVERLGRAPFISIDSFSNAPPANPAANALVVVGAAPTGAFAGEAHKFAQWNGATWQTAIAHRGTIVHDIATGTYWRRTADGWAPFVATETEPGLVTLADLTATATLAEVAAGTVTDKYVSPATLRTKKPGGAAFRSPTYFYVPYNTSVQFGPLATYLTSSDLVDSVIAGNTVTIGAIDAGLWLLMADFSVAGYVDGAGLVRIYRNTDLIAQQQTWQPQGYSKIPFAACVVRLAVGDMVRLDLFQNVMGGQDCLVNFSLIRMGA